MKEYRTKSSTVRAVQITDEFFDAPHPNPLHPIGVLIDPRDRTVTVRWAPGMDPETVGIGYWLVAGDIEGEFSPLSDDAFRAQFEVPNE